MRRRTLLLLLPLLLLALLLGACGLLPGEAYQQPSELPEGTAYLQLLKISKIGKSVFATVCACGRDYEPLSQTSYRFPLDAGRFVGYLCPQYAAGAPQAETYRAADMPEYYRDAQENGGFQPVCCDYLFNASGELTLLDDMYQPALPPESEPTEEPTEESTEPAEYPPYVSDYDGSLGSAGSLRGRTLIISVFTNDNATCWDPAQDAGLMAQTLTYLTTAAQWLTEQAQAYGAEAEFIYDWSVCEDLRYDAVFPENLVTPGVEEYETQVAYLQENIDVQRLVNKYRADNVIYFFYFNTEYENEVRPWSLGYTSSELYMTEIVNMYLKYEGCFDAPPATYAHEILHTFGAYDLYYSSAAISSNYVNHCEETGSNDIMFTVNAENYITVELTPLDAYYVGIGARPAEVGEWNLFPSEHESCLNGG